jgi:hypothetical protein
LYPVFAIVTGVLKTFTYRAVVAMGMVASIVFLVKTWETRAYNTVANFPLRAEIRITSGF